jgi:hypothetical protein
MYISVLHITKPNSLSIKSYFRNSSLWIPFWDAKKMWRVFENIDAKQKTIGLVKRHVQKEISVALMLALLGWSSTSLKCRTSPLTSLGSGWFLFYKPLVTLHYRSPSCTVPWLQLCIALCLLQFLFSALKFSGVAIAVSSNCCLQPR